jgi:hemoglobin/transferrin/lactoferrin receptor protein
MAVRFDAFTAEPQGNNDLVSSKENAWTGKLGAVYHWNEAWSTFGQFSQGFKAPTLYDMYYQYSMGATILPNPNLRSERSNAVEIGSRWRSEAGRLSLAAFYNFYDDFIEQVKIDEDKNGDVMQNVNIAKATIYGIELSSDWDLNALVAAPKGSYFQFSAAYAKGENSENGQSLDSVAPLSGSMTLGFDSLDARFGSAFTVKAAAGKSGEDWSKDDNLAVAGYAVVDLTGYYRPMTDLTIRAGVFNAFNKQYWHYSDLEGVTETQGLDRRSQSGRHWGLEVEYVF